MADEIWKDIVGSEGLYQVSNYGMVKSLKNKFKPFKSFSLSKVGYPYVSLWENNKQVVFYIHRLVAIHFIPNKEGKKYVNHINSDKLDFRLENLEWVNNIENSHHYANSRENKSSKYTGVYHHSGKWESACWFENRKHYIGRFVTEDEAKDAQIKFMAENKIVNKYAVK